MNETGKTKMLGTRISKPLYKVVQVYLKKNACINESDLLRRALSEYLKREIPSLYREIMDLR